MLWLANSQVTGHPALAGLGPFSPRDLLLGSPLVGPWEQAVLFPQRLAPSSLVQLSDLTRTNSSLLQAPLRGRSGHQLVTSAQSVPLLHSDQGLPVSKYRESLPPGSGIQAPLLWHSRVGGAGRRHRFPAQVTAQCR